MTEQKLPNMLNQYKIIGLYSDGQDTNKIVKQIQECCPKETFRIIYAQNFYLEIASKLFHFDINNYEANSQEMNAHWKQSNEKLVEITRDILRKVPKNFPKLDWTCGNEKITEKLNFSSKYLFQRLSDEIKQHSDTTDIFLIPDLQFMDEAFVIEKMNGLLIQITSTSSSSLNIQEEEKQNHPPPRNGRGRKRKAQSPPETKTKTKTKKNKNGMKRKMNLNEKLDLDSNYYHFSLTLGQPENITKLLSTFFNSTDLGDLFKYTFTVTDTFMAPHSQMRPLNYKNETPEVQIPIPIPIVS